VTEWKPDSYLRFEKERTQPSIDLATRIKVDSPKRIIDMGCGPGNSTMVLRNRWPEAEVIGVDNSTSMLERARERGEDIVWIHSDIDDDLSSLGKCDICFSNAAIQWLPNQAEIVPKLFDTLNAGGVLAVQVPDVTDMPPHTIAQDFLTSPKWRSRFADFSSTFTTHALEYYYDILSALSDDVTIWATDYCHVMDSPDDIAEWYRSSGLRPFLDCLDTEESIDGFIHDYIKEIEKAYTPQADGKLLLRFTRIFFLAYAR